MTDSHYVIGGARVAELADALDLGSSGRKVVGVQVPPLALMRFNYRPGNFVGGIISGFSSLGGVGTPAVAIGLSLGFRYGGW